VIVGGLFVCEEEMATRCWQIDRMGLLRLADYEMPMLSMSRMRQAICARLAASATRLKSRRKASVFDDDSDCCRGAGGTNDCDGDDC
jgi:hypothetical protein